MRKHVFKNARVIMFQLSDLVTLSVLSSTELT